MTFDTSYDRYKNYMLYDTFEGQGGVVFVEIFRCSIDCFIVRMLIITENSQDYGLDHFQMLCIIFIFFTLSALLALLLFFLFERLINMVGEWRVACKGRNQVELPQTNANDVLGRNNHDGASSPKQTIRPSTLGTTSGAMQVKVVRTGHKASDRSLGRERLCKHKYSNYCVDDVLEQEGKEANEADGGPRAVADEVTTLMVGTDTTDTLVQSSNNLDLESTKQSEADDLIVKYSNGGGGGTIFEQQDTTTIKESNNIKYVYVREHEHVHHGHSHAHSHIHSAPDSISSVGK